MKKLSIVLLTCIAGLSFAGEKSIEEQRREYERNYLLQNALAVPDGGVKIVPRSELKEWQNHKNEFLAEHMLLQDKGYTEKYDPYIDRLVHLNAFVKKQKKFNGFNQNSTELRESIADLEIAYEYKQIPFNLKSNSFGIAPYLNYIKDKGWAGVSELFDSSLTGNCQYFENNIKLTHGSIVLGKEDVEYLVNNKPSLLRVYGNNNQGFVYEIEWYNNQFFKQLSCALPEYNSGARQNLIDLANQIDNKDK